jgi:hypothetical protein
MALLATQKDKLSKPLSEFMSGTLVPGQYAWMDRKGMLMCPYFETTGTVPETACKASTMARATAVGMPHSSTASASSAKAHMLKPYRLTG